MESDIVWGRNMFRNREIMRFSMIYAILSIIFVVFSFEKNRVAGFTMLFAVIVFGVLFFVFTKARYQKIAKISEQIDCMLHEEQYIHFSDANEGELAVLQSEISKMMLRIREQKDTLEKDKKYLANALADIAHQLKTPLTSLNLIVTLLEKTKEQGEQKMFFREMEELFLRMDWLITTLLKISKLDAQIALFQKEQIEVLTLLQAAVRPVMIQMELHQITLEIDVQENIFIQGDFEWLVEAIQNIVKNCMESVKEAGSIHVSCIDNPLYTQLSIQDDGSGFQTEDLPYVFDRFYRGKNQNHTGYGIGLALSKMIIKGHGGTIAAKNHPKKGALFIIRFPK